jgi:hypothetical protein
MANIFERAWGNYAAFLEFVINGKPSDDEDWFDEKKGLVQMYAFASLLPYTLTKDNYDNFLLMNSVNYVSPGKVDHDNSDHVEKHTQLEHRTPLVPQYSYFLDRLDSLIAEAVDPRDEPKYEELQGKVTKSQQSLLNYQRFVDGGWADYVLNNPGIPTEELRARRVIWERDNGHSIQLKHLKNLVSQDNSRLNAWLRSKLKPELHALLKARQFFDDPGYQIKLPIAADHDDPSKIDYWREFPMQLPRMQLDEFLTNDAMVSHTFLTKEEHYKRVEEKWKVSAKGRWGIFRGGGSAERRTLEELSTKSEFSVEVSFKRFEEVPIFRDEWFQEVLFSTVGKQFAEFWGPGGLLATYPKTLIVARGMTVKVGISDEYKRTLEKYFATGGSVRFGPFFSGGGNYSKDEKYMDYRFTQQGFELSDSEKTIRLLGARVARPNWSKALADGYYSPITIDDLMAATKAMDEIIQRKEDGPGTYPSEG